MDAIKTDANYLDLPPILIAASSDNAMTRAESGVIAAGYRVGARMPIESAAERIDQQLSAAGLWVEIDSDRGAAMDD
jgi:hypothetical protein